MEPEKNEKGFRKIYKSVQGYLIVALFTVCLYSFFENINNVTTWVLSVLGVLTPLFWGMIIAFIVNMPMRFLERTVFRRWKECSAKRGVCLTLGFLLVILIITLVMQMIVPRFVESAETIIVNFDSYIVSLDQWTNELSERFNMSNSDIKWLEATLQSIFDYIEELISRAVPMAVRLTVSIASITINALLALIMGFYVLFNKEKHIEQAKRIAYALFSEPVYDRILSVSARTNLTLNNYFRGMILECGILGSMCFVGMTIFRFPYALLISVIVGLTQIVPIIGPWFSAILGALIILMTDPIMSLWFLVFIVVVQQLECNLVYPRVVGNAVGLSGIWVMIAVLLGGGLFGVAGVILCVPAMAVIQTLVREWVDQRVHEKESERKGITTAEAQEPENVDLIPQPKVPKGEKQKAAKMKRRK